MPASLTVLANPTLELRDSNGALLIANDNWQDDPAQAAAIQASGLAPSNSAESAIVATLPSGPYTAIAAGLDQNDRNRLRPVLQTAPLGSGARADSVARRRTEFYATVSSGGVARQPRVFGTSESRGENAIKRWARTKK